MEEAKMIGILVRHGENDYELLAPEVMPDSVFEGFLEFVEEEMREDHPRFNDAAFWNLLPDYDTPEYLLDWYSCFEEDPLAADDEEDKDDD